MTMLSLTGKTFKNIANQDICQELVHQKVNLKYKFLKMELLKESIIEFLMSKKFKTINQLNFKALFRPKKLIGMEIGLIIALNGLLEFRKSLNLYFQ